MNLITYYSDPSFPGSFGGVTSFHRGLLSKGIKISKKEVQTWLTSQQVYSLHKPIVKTFQRNRVVVSGIDAVWQMDLVDVSSISKENNHIKFLLTAIDVFSKKAWVIPMKNKTGLETKEAIERIFKQERIPKKIQVDKGTEFYNKHVKSYLKKFEIELYSTKSELKASIVERFNRTLRTKMWKMFTLNSKFELEENHVFYKNLQKLVESYNNQFHRSIQMTPNQVNKSNEKQVWLNLYGYESNIGDETVVKPLYKVNDLIRITKDKFIFAKGYTHNWTKEIFKINKVFLTVPPTYEVIDFDNQIIQGKFYKEEIQKILDVELKEGEYFVEKILDIKGKKPKRQFFVKWQNYPSTENSWIFESNFV